MPSVRVQNGGGGSSATRLGRAGTAEQAVRVRTIIMGQRMLPSLAANNEGGVSLALGRRYGPAALETDGIRVA